MVSTRRSGRNGNNPLENNFKAPQNDKDGSPEIEIDNEATSGSGMVRTNPRNQEDDQNLFPENDSPLENILNAARNAKDGEIMVKAGDLEALLQEVRRQAKESHKNVWGEGSKQPHQDETGESHRVEGRGENHQRKAHGQLEGRLEDLNKQILEMQRRMPLQKKVFEKGMAFTPTISREPLPPHFRSVHLPEYLGTTDPEEHLERIQGASMLYDFSDGVRCRLLRSTLIGPALTWFNHLEANSIQNYADLTDLFLRQFASSKKSKRTAMHLMSIKQGEGESLRRYIQRFNTAAIEIPSLSQQVITQALLIGLKNEELYRSLAKRPAESLSELLDRAEKYINMEEAMKVRKESMEDKKRGKKEEAYNPMSRGDPRRSNREISRRGPDLPFAPRNNPIMNFTPLNEAPEKIFMTIERRERLNFPLSYGNPPRKPVSPMYCKFHCEYGHNTNSCQTLRKELERLIGEGKLKEYLIKGNDEKRKLEGQDQRDGTQGREDKRRNTGENGSHPRRIIHMISGGPTNGDSGRARRNYAKNVWRREEVKEVNHVTSSVPICFDEKDGYGLSFPHSDALVITGMIANCEVRRIFVDGGSSVDILFREAFEKLGLKKDDLEEVATPLIGFSGDVVLALGKISLPITLGEAPLQVMKRIEFLVVDTPSAYNAILGRTGLNIFQAVTSTLYLTMKFPVAGQVGVVRGDQQISRSCYVAALRAKNTRANIETKPATMNDNGKRPLHFEGKNREEAVRIRLEEGELIEKIPPRILPGEQICEVTLFDDLSKTVRIGALLGNSVRTELIELLKEYRDIFAWSPDELGQVDPNIMTHRLNIDTSIRPVKQKKRNFGAEKDAIIQAEVDRLLSAGQIKEILFPEWLSNVVLVPKAGQQWRVCIDFRDLNKACPKDSYPLPRIDQLVDSTSGCALLSMMDLSQGYHQILLDEEDQKRVCFITARGTYCYVVMPFGLKNAGATYQRLMDKLFKDLIGRSVEIYIDDMLVKSVRVEEHVSDLRESFTILRKNNMKLNPKKCSFGVQSGKFLGYLVTPKGIEVNPEKVRAIKEMSSPTTQKEVQRLAGRMAALSRFVSKSAERCGPFFKILRKNRNFQWNDECEKAFQKVKEYLTNPPLLTKPEKGDILLLYLSVTDTAISSVLIREEGKKQRPIYYVSKVLLGAETRYLTIEKLALALVVTARRLRPYFLSHPIIVLTDQPLKKIMEKPEVSGRLVKWSIELSEFDISYQPRPAIKAQVLADFLTEMIGESEEQKKPWLLHIDGSSGNQGSGVGVVLTSPDGDESEFAIKLTYSATNNEAEYEALICGLNLAHDAGAKKLCVFSDSQLVISQMKGQAEVKDPKMIKLHQKVSSLAEEFEQLNLDQIPRAENNRADVLAKMAAGLDGNSSRKITVLSHPGESMHVSQINLTEEDWREVFIKFLQKGELPIDKNQSGKIRSQAHKYALIGEKLYRKTYAGPLAKCIAGEETCEILKEIHEGLCGMHIGGRALANVTVRAGFYWPTLANDAADYVRRCDGCQRHANWIHQPATEMTALSSPYPFAQWGIDLVGPFPIAQGQKKNILVAIDYFTKWVEAEALGKATGEQISKFLWKNIVSRYGIPRVIISDNGSQFAGREVREFCEHLKIRQSFASVYHPQANGQVEVTNRTILEGIKARLGEKGRFWLNELPKVLWAYRTSPRSTTGETPFSLVYGMEAVIPVEVLMESERVLTFQPEQNEEMMQVELEFIDEKRGATQIRMEEYMRRMIKGYNKRVKNRAFQVGDLVLKRADLVKAPGKISPKWEGPFKIIEVIGAGAYRMEDQLGRTLPNTWNVANLKKYFA